MRSPIFWATGLAGIALAAPAPAPQDIDFALAESLPDPTSSVQLDATVQYVTYNPSAIFESALSQVTASVTTDSVATSTQLDRRDATSCTPLPTGAGPIPTPDTPSAFLALPDFSSAAVAAPTPTGYYQTFQNLNASNNAYGYLGYKTLKSYDVQGCANSCNNINGCMAFNIYFERDPSLDPGSGTNCSNPASTTNIKCVWWGGSVTYGNAVNTGQWRNQFQVVIAGSNGYVNYTVPPPAGGGWNQTDYLGAAAINAPLDKYGSDTFLGVAIFNAGPFDPTLCAQACTEKNNYAIAHPPSDGGPVKLCKFFNTYILYINSTSNPANNQGQYCAMYSETWNASYATNFGQYRGSDHYMIQDSYTYSNTTDPGLPDPKYAVYQASKDISWDTLQPFCTTYLGYNTTSTATTLTTEYDTTTAVGTVTSYSTLYQKREAQPTPAPVARRDSSVPPQLSKYPPLILSSACSLQATAPPAATITSTVSSYVATVNQTSTVPATTTISHDDDVVLAANDIIGNSLQPFCSTLLGYNIPTTTTTSQIAYTAVIGVSTTTTTSMATLYQKRDSQALVTPDVLLKYPADVVASACNLEATSAPAVILTISSTQTSSTATTTTTTVQATSTIAHADDIVLAGNDISGNSLQPFCSSLLGFATTQTVTASTMIISTTIGTTTITETSMATLYQKRTMLARQALVTPAILLKYPTDVVSSACGLQATSPPAVTTIIPWTSVSTTSTSTTTTVAATSTIPHDEDVAMATSDISAASLLPFCSTYLGWNLTPTISTTVTLPFTVVATATITSTSLATFYQKRDASPEPTAGSLNVIERDATVPRVLSKYPTDVISSACSQQATSPAAYVSTITAYTPVTSSTSTTLLVTATTTPSRDVEVAMASSDISNGTLQPFCSTLLGYNTPGTVTSTTTYTPVATTRTTTTATSTSTRYQKREDELDYATDAALPTRLDKRALVTPSVLQKYPASIVSSACNLQATAPPSTTVVATVTQSTATTTIVQTATATATACVANSGKNFRLQVVAPGTPYDGLFVQNPTNIAASLGISALETSFSIYSSSSPVHWNLDASTGYVQDANAPYFNLGWFSINGAAMYMNPSKINLPRCAIDPTTQAFTCTAYDILGKKYTNGFYMNSDHGLYVITISDCSQDYFRIGFKGAPIKLKAVC